MFPKLLLRVGGALLFGKYRVDLFHRKLKLRLRSGGGANVQRRQGCAVQARVKARGTP